MEDTEGRGFYKGAKVDDSGAARGKVLDDPLFDNADISEEEARQAGLVLAGIAIEKGAKSSEVDGEYDPCGLDDIMDALFGEPAPDITPRPIKERPTRQMSPARSISGLKRDGLM